MRYLHNELLSFSRGLSQIQATKNQTESQSPDSIRFSFMKNDSFEDIPVPLEDAGFVIADRV